MSNAREFASRVPVDGALSNRNLIINGAMQVAQRGTSFSSLSSSQFCLDRFSVDIGGGGAITVDQSTTTPDDFKNSMKLTVSTADSSIAAGDAYRSTHAIEGQNIAHLNWGTSSAKDVTLSFWVRSSVTGTYGLGLANNAETENYVAEYTINAANTWEKKTINIDGPTSGTWLTTNGVGIGLRFDVGSGTNYNGTAGSWQTTGSKVYRTSSCVNWIANAGATFYITGVQLEVGDTATPFEHRSYGDELARCQRYFEVLTASAYGAYANGWFEGTSTFKAFCDYKVVKRAVPTLSSSGSFSADGASSNPALSSLTGGAQLNGAVLEWSCSGATSGQGANLINNNDAAAIITFDAEL